MGRFVQGRWCAAPPGETPDARGGVLPEFERKPSKQKRCVGRPLTARAAMRAQGPGMGMISIPFSAQSLTSSSPGSEMAGVPASVTSAPLSRRRSRGRMSSACSL
jgi:hypothetical protein